jgi:hypothetical protein
MQKALIHEHIIQVLSQPHNLSSATTITTSDGNHVDIKGFGCAHFAALQYVNALAMSNSSLQPHNDEDGKRIAEIKIKCAFCCWLLFCARHKLTMFTAAICSNQCFNQCLLQHTMRPCLGLDAPVWSYWESSRQLCRLPRHQVIWHQYARPQLSSPCGATTRPAWHKLWQCKQCTMQLEVCRAAALQIRIAKLLSDKFAEEASVTAPTSPTTLSNGLSDAPLASRVPGSSTRSNLASSLRGGNGDVPKSESAGITHDSTSSLRRGQHDIYMPVLPVFDESSNEVYDMPMSPKGATSANDFLRAVRPPHHA